MELSVKVLYVQLFNIQRSSPKKQKIKCSNLTNSKCLKYIMNIVFHP